MRALERLELVRGDITAERADAIVNAANSSLLGGGCETGDAKATGAGHLPARHVIHTVGPVWQDGASGEDELLASCHRRALEIAASLECRTVAFPAVSTSVYRFPVERAARVALRATVEALERHASIERVTFVLFSDDHHRAFERALRELATESGDAVDEPRASG
ncbi:MAG: macro domain-containing protein [Actinobacteria bacterium]|nr:macro domain-containing protein [Actinomycetota bacterium]